MRSPPLIPQIVGLVGRNGILPAGPGDAILRAACIGGALVSLVLVAGFIPIVAVPLLWLLYWWLSTIAAEFLSCPMGRVAARNRSARDAGRADGLARTRERSARTATHRGVVDVVAGVPVDVRVGRSQLASGDPTWRDLAP